MPKISDRAKNIGVNALIFGAFVFVMYKVWTNNYPPIKEDLEKNFGL